MPTAHVLLRTSSTVLSAGLGIQLSRTQIHVESRRMVDQEQLLATIMLNCAGGTPYVAQNILVQYMPMFYNQRWAGGFGYGFLVILVTQFMGFGLSGLLRRVGAYPVTAMWPTVLPTLAVNRVLLAPGRKGENINGWTISR